MCFPHIVKDGMLAAASDMISGSVLTRHTGVCQVLELITSIVGIVVLRCKAHIGRLPHPNGQWVDTGYHDPLPDVELLSKDN